MTKTKLIELLSVYNDNSEIRSSDGQDFIHIVNLTDGTIILSTQKPIGTCNRCGEYVYPTTTKGYAAYCPELDEDLYKFEFTPIKNEIMA